MLWSYELAYTDALTNIGSKLHVFSHTKYKQFPWIMKLGEDRIYGERWETYSYNENQTLAGA